MNIAASSSPDGKKVAVTLSKDDNSEVYVMGRTGKNPVRLTRDWAIDIAASWSPDGKRLAFVSERSGNPQIYMMNADGSGVKRLTFQGNYNQSPDWSPQGDVILFNARDERLVYDIFNINPDTGVISRLTQDQGNNEHPTFSPDGNLVVFSSTRAGESKLYVMNADGTNQHMISRRKGEYTTPEWGPWSQGKNSGVVPCYVRTLLSSSHPPWLCCWLVAPRRFPSRRSMRPSRPWPTSRAPRIVPRRPTRLPRP
jgi:TolB protein